MRLAGKRLRSPLAVQPCRAAVNECNSRAADGVRRNRRVGRRSGCSCGEDWHRACGLEKKKQDEKEGQA
eukprot:2699283-Pleurochrysis_carterae.AAC.1